MAEENKNTMKEDTIRLVDDTGYEMDYMVIESVDVDYDRYDILVPVQKADDIVELTGVLILKKELGIGPGMADYSVEEDPEILEYVFKTFKEKYEAKKNK